MRKLLLVKFAAATLASVVQGGAATMPRPQITVSPTPMFAGQQVTIHAGPNMDVIIDLDPGGRWRVTTDANGNADWTPPNAGSLFVSDPTGAWLPAGDVVAP